MGAVSIHCTKSGTFKKVCDPNFGQIIWKKKKAVMELKVFYFFFYFSKSATASVRLSEEAGTGMSETHHFAE